MRRPTLACCIWQLVNAVELSDQTIIGQIDLAARQKSESFRRMLH